MKQTQELHDWLAVPLNCQFPPWLCCGSLKLAFSPARALSWYKSLGFVHGDCPSYLSVWTQQQGLRAMLQLRTLSLSAIPKYGSCSFVKLNILQFTFYRTGKNPRDSVQIYNELASCQFMVMQTKSLIDKMQEK